MHISPFFLPYILGLRRAEGSQATHQPDTGWNFSIFHKKGFFPLATIAQK
jgi:hypothetical protein